MGPDLSVAGLYALGVSFLLLEIVIVGRDLGVGVIVCVFSGMRDFRNRWIMASGLPASAISDTVATCARFFALSYQISVV